MTTPQLEQLPAEDQARVRHWAVFFAGAKQAAEFFGRRPRRFRLMPDTPLASLGPRSKRIHFIRHGEGHHNVWRAAEFAAGRKPHAKRGNIGEVPAELHDPDLTARGRAEATASREAARRTSPELLVTSPVRRAVQTLLLAFEDAVAAGVPIVAHELCREQFQGLDPSIYDARRGRRRLAEEFPQIDFDSYVVPEPGEGGPPHGGGDPGLQDDPLWWHGGSPLGTCEGGVNLTAVVEHGYGFLCWLMAQPEREITVATHSLFLVGLYHGSLDPPGAAEFPSPQVFATGELRSVVIEEVDAPEGVGACLSAFGPPLLGAGFGPGGPAAKRRRPGVAPVAPQAAGDGA